MEPVHFLTQNSEPLSLVDILQSARDRLRAVAMHRARLQENQILMDPPFRKTLYSGHCRTPGTPAALKKPQRSMPQADLCAGAAEGEGLPFSSVCSEPEGLSKKSQGFFLGAQV